MTAFKKQEIFYPFAAFSVAGHSAGYLASQHLEKMEELPQSIEKLFSCCEGAKTLDKFASASLKKTKSFWNFEVYGEILRYHLKLFHKITIGPSAFEKMLTRIFEYLANKGYFISEADFWKSLELVGSVLNNAAPKNNERLETIGIVTRNRPSELRSALKSHMESLSKLSQRAIFYVSDDSDNPEAIGANLKTITDLSEQFKCQVKYASRTEKEKLIENLAQRGISEKILRFAFGQKSYNFEAHGANRNFLSLLTSGRKVLNIDDDTVGHVTAAKEYKKGLSFNHEPGFQVHAYLNREDALQSVNPLERSVLDLHDQLLGKRLSECLTHEKLNILGSDFNVGNSHFRKLLNPNSKVVLTFNGLVGDSGCASDSQGIALALKDKESYFRNLSIYRERMASRENVKTCDQILLYRAKGCMTTFFGMDNRDVLPPFFPHFRMEDALFAESLFLTDNLGYFASLPFQLMHFPYPRPNNLKTATDSSIQTTEKSKKIYLDTHEIISATLKSWRPSLCWNPLRKQIESLGRHFTEISKLDDTEFRELLLPPIIATIHAELTQIEGLLKSNPKTPRYWKADVHAKIEYLKSRLDGDFVFGSLRIHKNAGAAGCLKLSREMIAQFGELMTVWPTVIDVYRSSGIEGCLNIENGRISRPISHSAPLNRPQFAVAQ